MNTQKPNCYECVYRRKIPGDAHSQCCHPQVTAQGDQMMTAMLLMMSPPPLKPLLGVTGNPHGIANGWFTWPWNFDPVWLDSCDGFEKKEQP